MQRKKANTQLNIVEEGRRKERGSGNKCRSRAGEVEMKRVGQRLTPRTAKKGVIVQAEKNHY